MAVEDTTDEASAANLNKFVTSEDSRRIFHREAIVYLNGATPALATVPNVNDGFDLSAASAGGVYAIGFSGPAFTRKPTVLMSIQSDGSSVKGYSAECIYIDDDSDRIEVWFHVVKDNATVTDALCYVHIAVIGEIA